MFKNAPFWQGVGSVLRIAPVGYHSNIGSHINTPDSQATHDDWLHVGMDMRSSCSQLNPHNDNPSPNSIPPSNKPPKLSL